MGQNIHRRIRDVGIADHTWQRKHWTSLQANYGRAAYFQAVAAWLAPLYLEQVHTNLSALNRALISALGDYLGIRTRLHNS